MKTIVSVLFMLSASYMASAQNVSWGPTVGLGHSWLTGADNVVFKPGVNIGGTIVYSPAEHWGLGGDIRASFLEGVKTSQTIGNTDSKTTLNATYLRIPLKVTHFFGQHGDRVRPKLFAGPSFGFLLGGKMKTDPASAHEMDAKDVLETFDFGFVAGAGLNYRIQKYTWLNIDLVYNNGLIDATKQTSLEQHYNANRNIGVNVGVTFPLGTVTP